MMMQPLVKTDDALGILVNVDRILKTEALQCVQYLSSAGATWPHGHRHDSIHEVDMGVVLITNRGTAVEVTWAMEGAIEGLAITISQTPENIDRRLSASDVSQLPGWQEILGLSACEIGTAWHVPNEGCPQSLWSLRITYSNNCSVVIALGEVDEGSMKYQPDGLVVIFDEAATASYRIAASNQSSWGELLDIDLE
jgi:hypothetical protein